MNMLSFIFSFISPIVSLLLVLTLTRNTHGQPYSLEIKKAAELSNAFSATIQSIHPLPNKKQALLIVDIQTEPIHDERNLVERREKTKKIIQLWSGEPFIDIRTAKVPYNESESQLIYPLHVHEGQVHALFTHPINNSSYALLSWTSFNAQSLTQERIVALPGDNFSKKVPLFNEQGEQIGEEDLFSSQISPLLLNKETIPSHLLSDGSLIVALTHPDLLENGALHVSKWGPFFSSLRWSTPIIPGVQKSPFMVSLPLLAVSSQHHTAVAFQVAPQEAKAFARFHSLTAPHESGYFYAMAFLDPSGHLLKLIYPLNEDIEVIKWMDDNTLITLSRFASSNNRRISITYLNEENQCKLPPLSFLQIEKENFNISGAEIVSPHFLLIIGSIGGRYASTGSLVGYARGFIALYNLKDSRIIAIKHMGQYRHNAVIALAKITDNEFLISTMEDAPLSHAQGQQQRSKSAIYQVFVR